MMTPAELDLRRYAVLGLVAEAGRMALDYFGKQESLGVTMKGAQDWLTVADGAVEDFLRRRLVTNSWGRNSRSGRKPAKGWDCPASRRHSDQETQASLARG